MDKLLIKNYVANLGKNALSCMVLFVLFLVSYMYIEELYDTGRSSNFNYDKEHTFYYSVEETALNDSMLDYKEKVESLRNTKYIEDVGYELSQFAMVDNETYTMVYLGGYAAKLDYQLDKGEWIETEDSKGVVLGGEVARNYTVGDKIKVYNDDGESIEYLIKGILKKSDVMLLNVRAGDNQPLKFQEIISKRDSVIFTTDEAAIETFNLESYDSSYILKGNEKAKEYLNGNFVSFEDIEYYSDVNKKNQYKSDMPLLTIFLLYCFSTLIFEIAIGIYRELDNLKCIYVCGASIKQMALFLLGNSYINYSVMFMLSIIYYRVKFGESEEYLGVIFKVSLCIVTIILLLSYIIAYVVLNRKLDSKGAD